MNIFKRKVFIVIPIILIIMSCIFFINCSRVKPTQDNLQVNTNLNVSIKDSDKCENEINYQDIIETARRCVKETDKSKLSKKDLNVNDQINISVEFLADSKDYQTLGYLFYDINADGVKELILGENPTENNNDWKGKIYDIYTIVDGNIVQICDGASRYCYYICKDGMVSSESFTDGFSYGYSYYLFDYGKMNLIETVIYKEASDTMTEWLYSNEYTYQSHDNTELYEIIDEKKAKEIMGKYAYIYPIFEEF